MSNALETSPAADDAVSVASIQGSLQTFCQNCDDWQQDWLDLFTEFQAALTGALPAADGELASRLNGLQGGQSSISADLHELRQLVEAQQTLIRSALESGST